MRIIFYKNSGFLFETPDCDILVDYIGGGFRKNADKRLYILASHAHGDHYSRGIRDFDGDTTIYILSSDIAYQRAKNVRFLSKGESFADGSLTVTAFGSTDAGVSFLLDAAGLKIFHAGDLNNWHWDEESTAEEIAEAEAFFSDELADIALKCPEIDIALFPVDPRLGKNYAKGAAQFLDKIRVSTFIPMHFGDRYDKANMFETEAVKRGAAFIKIHGSGPVCAK